MTYVSIFFRVAIEKFQYRKLTVFKVQNEFARNCLKVLFFNKLKGKFKSAFKNGIISPV